MVEEPGHQHRVEVAGPVDHHAEHLDGRDAELAQLAQQPVLAPGQPLVELLERVDLAALGDEPDDVPGDAALADLHQPLVGPLRDRGRHGRDSSPAVLSAGGAKTKRTLCPAFR